MADKPRMCPHCRAFIDPKASVCEYCDGKIGRPSWKRPDPGVALGGFIQQSHYTTFIILVINFALFIATMVMTSKMQGGSISLFGGIDGRILVAFGAKDTFRIVAREEWWRLITAGFLHGGALHFMMNSWVLFDLGATVEEFLRYVAFSRDLHRFEHHRIRRQHVLDTCDLDRRLRRGLRAHRRHDGVWTPHGQFLYLEVLYALGDHASRAGLINVRY